MGSEQAGEIQGRKCTGRPGRHLSEEPRARAGVVREETTVSPPHFLPTSSPLPPHVLSTSSLSEILLDRELSSRMYTVPPRTLLA